MADQGSKVKESGGTQAKANSWLTSSWTELPIGWIAVQFQTWDSASRKQHFHTDHEPALLTQFLALIISKIAPGLKTNMINTSEATVRSRRWERFIMLREREESTAVMIHVAVSSGQSIS